MIAAGDQIVVERGMIPMTFCRKCPWLATNRGALDDSPYCHRACEAYVTPRRNGKSIAISRRSASAAKNMATIGPRAYPSPQNRYDAAPALKNANMTNCFGVRGSR